MKVGNINLDKAQQQIIYDNSRYLLVTAGAGSGKTFTILGKIKYLVNDLKLSEKEILCLTFTKNAASSLSKKIKKELLLNIDVYTFHKLSLDILTQSNFEYSIASTNLLDDVTNKFFSIDIYKSEYLLDKICVFFHLPRKDTVKSYKSFYNNNYQGIEELEKLCITFIRLLKCNNYSLNDFSYYLSRIRKTLNYFRYVKEKILLTFILNIYIIYTTYLKDENEIDFDDMIIKATSLINNNGLDRKIKYVIVDEYQDTSYIRFLLINAIVNKSNANLLVVGDDFQSIYRFTGCDISLFLDFKKYFADAHIKRLEKTYRNSQELIEVAGKFVMKNKKQIRKKLYSDKNLNNPIRIVFYRNIRKEFITIIKYLSENYSNSIMVLGRNNFDVYMLVCDDIKYINGKIIVREYEFLDIDYMTVHKSKGLEDNNVILINLLDKQFGFPNKLKDEKILRLVTKKYDNYLYSEERRLFYVALTRTKNFTYLLVPKNNPSIFVQELNNLIYKNK